MKDLSDRIYEIFSTCERDGITLSVQDGNLKYASVRSLVEQEFKNSLRELKPALCEILTHLSAGHSLLSFAQMRYWAHYRASEGADTYNNTVLLRFSGNADIGRLKAAITLLASRHPLMNMKVRTIMGAPIYLIDPISHDPKISLYDNVDDAATYLAEDSKVPFNLETDLPWRASIISERGGAIVLGLTIHHIASDGWSLAFILKQLGEAYQSLGHASASGADFEVSVGAPYAQFVDYERRLVNSPIGLIQKEYWLRTLHPTREGHSPSKITTSSSARIETRERIISNAAIDRLQQLASIHHVSLFTVLLASYYLSISSAFAETDVYISTPAALRDLEEFSSTFGPFVNYIVLRCEVNSSSTMTSLLPQLKETVRNGFENRYFPIDLLKLHWARGGLSSHPFSNRFVFNLIPFSPELPSFGDAVVECVDLISAPGQFSLKLYCWRVAEGLLVRAVFNTEHVAECEAEKVLERFLVNLGAT